MSETKTPLVSLEEMEFEDPIQPPNSLRRRIAVKPMVLMGTGPTNPSKRVSEALIKPVMGLYTDEYTQVNYIQSILLYFPDVRYSLLRKLFIHLHFNRLCNCLSVLQVKINKKKCPQKINVKSIDSGQYWSWKTTFFT